jgi:hypothetical protein
MRLRRNSLARSALLDTRAVVSLLAGGVTAVATGWWWLLAPAVLLYLWLARAAAAEALDPFALCEPDLAGLQGRCRRRAEAGLDIQQRLQTEMRSAPPYLQDAMQSTWNQVRALGDQELALVRQLQNIEAYVRRLDPQQLDAEWRDLVARRDGARDPTAREQYEQALALMQGQVGNLNELRASAERIDAQLHTVQHTLENIYGQVLRLKTVDPGAGDLAMTELGANLQGLTDQMGALSESVQQVYLRSGGGGR